MAKNIPKTHNLSYINPVGLIIVSIRIEVERIMKIAFFDTHQFEMELFLKESQRYGFHIDFHQTRLNSKTAALANGAEIVCCFVNDRIDAATIEQLEKVGVKLIALRCAGYNNVDLAAAKKHQIKVVRVPEYSPHAVAEHAVGLILTLNRKIHRAFNRVREANFNLDGLVGFDMYNKTVGVIGTGRIGKVFAEIMKGFSCEVIVADPSPDVQWAKSKNIKIDSLENLLMKSDVISLHCPLNPTTFHLINEQRLKIMKDGVMLINTGRGALIDAKAVIEGLKSGKIGSAGLDVYEEEENYFFKDLSNTVLKDDVLARFLTFPNVIITSHQAFLTHEALLQITKVTLQNIDEFAKGQALKNSVTTTN